MAAVFAGSVAFVVLLGTRLAGVADQLADRTGLGEALVGAVLVGASTSLPGATVSFVAALDGDADLAATNAISGILAQTAFLGVADMAYRRANLEHAAASAENLVQATLLVLLLALILVGVTGPSVVLWRIHPITLVLLASYLGGLSLIRQVREHPMWTPRVTSETRQDRPSRDTTMSSGALWLRYFLYAPALLACGFLIERTASAGAGELGLSSSITGSFLTAVPTSFPELVIAVGAVRRGALTLAVGNILGGNAFDTLFLAVADVGYGGGSLYHQAGRELTLLTASSILATAVLLLGFIRRECRGPGTIGFESVLMLVVTIGTYLLLFFL